LSGGGGGGGGWSFDSRLEQKQTLAGRPAADIFPEATHLRFNRLAEVAGCGQKLPKCGLFLCLVCFGLPVAFYPGSNHVHKQQHRINENSSTGISPGWVAPNAAAE